MVPEQSGPKVGAAVPLSVKGAGSPSNTMLPGPSPTFVPSGILIHTTVWPQYVNVTIRQTAQRDRQDMGAIAEGEPFFCEPFYKRSSRMFQIRAS